MARLKREDFFPGVPELNYFDNGAQPDENAFRNLMDSFLNIEDDKVYPKDGKIGIGVEDPLEKLHVNGNIRISKEGKGGMINSDGYKLTLASRTSTDDSLSFIEMWGWGVENAAGEKRYGELTLAGENISIRTGTVKLNDKGEPIFDEDKHYGSVKVVVKNNGNVGIGTEKPEADLHVDGWIKTNSLKVDGAIEAKEVDAKLSSRNIDGTEFFSAGASFDFLTFGNTIEEAMKITSTQTNCLKLVISQLDWDYNKDKDFKFIDFCFHKAGDELKNVTSTAQISLGKEGNKWNGVTFSGLNKDFAEYIPSNIEPSKRVGGAIVSIDDGETKFLYENKNHYSVISTAPFILGNWQGDDNLELTKTTLLGQVPSSIIGKVKSGDYIFPDIDIPGKGMAVSPDDVLNHDISQIVGVAWESSDDEKEKLINTFVNIPIYNRIMQQMLDLIRDLEKQVKNLENQFHCLTLNHGIRSNK
jgi:hypothetical protein